MKPKTEIEKAEVAVEDAIIKYSGRNFRAICIAAFLAGGWATRAQMQLSRVETLVEGQYVATQARIVEWSAWREGVDEKFRTAGSDRFTGTNWNTAAAIYNMRNPPNPLPYLHEIKAK